MRLDVFQKWQADPAYAYMCINLEHTMPLIAVKNLDDQIELRCFAGHCDFKIVPGINVYNKVLEKYDNN